MLQGVSITVGGSLAVVLATVDRLLGGRLAKKLLPEHYKRSTWSKLAGSTITALLVWVVRFSGGRNVESPVKN